MKKLLIVGTGGHARMAIDIAQSMGFTVTGLIDIYYSNKKEKILGIEVLGNISAIPKASNSNLFVAIGDNKSRKKIMSALIDQEFNISTLIHPTAFVSQYAKIEMGSIIMPNATVNAECIIGLGTIVNTAASIDHECIVGKFSHIAPGVHIAGRVKIGDETFIGIGSAVSNNLCIGDHVIVGANSTVTTDISDGSKYVGHKKFLK